MFEIDIHEPSNALLLISSSIPDARVDSLNEHDWADYRWNTYQDTFVQVERKQWAEVLSGMDKVEDQLMRHIRNQREARLVFLIEGMITGSSMGTRILKSTNKDNIYVTGHQSSIRLSQVYAWLYGISKYIEVIQTSNYEATCMALVAMYKWDQKSEEQHSTFKRYYKKLEFSPNPQVVQLMGLLPGIGETRAKALIDKYTTVWQVVSSTPEELAKVDGIGKILSKQLLQRVGRVDV